MSQTYDGVILAVTEAQEKVSNIALENLLAGIAGKKIPHESLELDEIIR